MIVIHLNVSFFVVCLSKELLCAFMPCYVFTIVKMLKTSTMSWVCFPKTIHACDRKKFQRKNVKHWSLLQLICHHLFWGIPQKKHNILDSEPSQNTITELVFVPDNIIDGIYLINLQVSNLSLDAAPSRPVLFPIIS